MTIDEWIAGNDSVDWKLNLEKIKLLDEVIALCLTTTLQRIYARQNKKISNFKEFFPDESGQDPDQLLPFENHYSSNSAFIEYQENLINARNDDAFALRALQEMASLDFDCKAVDPTPDGYFKRFEMVVAYGSVLYRLYAKLIPGKNYENVDAKKLQRIDLSMTKIVCEAGQMGAVSVEGVLDFDSNLLKKMKMDEGLANKVKTDSEIALEFYESLNDRTKKDETITSISKIIHKRWKINHEKEKHDKKNQGLKKPISDRTIREHLQKAGIEGKKTRHDRKSESKTQSHSDI